jgi:hypothetical protein
MDPMNIAKHKCKHCSFITFFKKSIAMLHNSFLLVFISKIYFERLYIYIYIISSLLLDLEM